MRQLLLCSCVLLAGCPKTPSPGAAADRILVGANVITLDPKNPTADFIAVKDGRILAVGTGEIARYRGEGTKVIHLGGATAVPGLIDAHIHYARLGRRARTVFLDETQNAGEAAAIVAALVSKASPGEWITGDGWHTTTWGTDDYPTRQALDAVAPDNPVYLVGMASHAAWVNTAALKLAGVGASTRDPRGGTIVREPRTGAPSGILLEEATTLVSKKIPKPTRGVRKADIARSGELAVELGLTEVHDAGTDDDTVAIYRELLAEGKLPVRLYAMYDVSDPGESLRKRLRVKPDATTDDPRLTLRAFKVYADGALGARGAALLEDYADAEGHRGLVQNDRAALIEIVTESTKAGYQVAVHAIGDRGNRNTLDAFEAARALAPDQRHRIEHAQVIAPSDIPRLGALGVVASMQPIHCTMDMGFAPARLGPKRLEGAYAWRSLLDSGAHVAASADTPAFPVAYTNPLWGMYAAVTRQDNSGQPAGGWTPAERVTHEEALRMYTTHAAWAAFEEDLKGTLEAGKLADVTVFSADILAVEAPELLKTEVVLTMVGGEVVYRARGDKT